MIPSLNSAFKTIAMTSHYIVFIDVLAVLNIVNTAKMYIFS